MSKAALSELSTLLRETVTHTGGKGSAVTMDKLAAQLSTRVWLLIGATPDLVELGCIVRRRDQQQFNWARDLVGACFGILRLTIASRGDWSTYWTTRFGPFRRSARPIADDSARAGPDADRRRRPRCARSDRVDHIVRRSGESYADEGAERKSHTIRPKGSWASSEGRAGDHGDHDGGNGCRNRGSGISLDPFDRWKAERERRGNS